MHFLTGCAVLEKKVKGMSFVFFCIHLYALFEKEMTVLVFTLGISMITYLLYSFDGGK